jgi:hypothetical protein
LSRDGQPAPAGYFYVADPALTEVFGEPLPVPGVRVVFDPHRLAAYGPWHRWPDLHKSRGPQGLVVFETPLDAQTWPCRLWRVDELGDAARPFPGSYFLRCASFVVREELPAWLVFGRQGERAATVIARATRLSQTEAENLAALPDEDAKRAYDAVFRRWRERHDRDDRSQGSLRPAGFGIGAVLGALDEAARRSDRDLFGWADEASNEPVLADPVWLRARRAIQSAVLALGADDVRPEERDALMRQWNLVLGPDW